MDGQMDRKEEEVNNIMDQSTEDISTVSIMENTQSEYDMSCEISIMKNTKSEEYTCALSEQSSLKSILCKSAPRETNWNDTEFYVFMRC